MVPLQRSTGFVHNIQMLRAIAALMVVAHHLRPMLADDVPGITTVYIGAAGVDVFFVISGFVIAQSLFDPKLSALAFMQRRLLRILPLYWLCLAVIGALLFVGLRPIGIQDGDATLVNVLKSLLFIPFERNGAGLIPLLGVGWTLNLEIFFYLICAGLLTVPARLRFAFLVAILTGLPVLGWILSPSRPPLVLFSQPLLLEFLAGCTLARWHFGAYRKPPPKICGYGLIAMGCLGLCLPDLLGWTQGFHTLSPQRWLFFGVPALTVVAGAVALERAGASVSSRNWALMGAASYAVYLTHPLILHVGDRLLLGSAPLKAAVLGGVCVIVGVLVHLGVEKPVLRRLRRLIRGTVAPKRMTPRQRPDVPNAREFPLKPGAQR